jgi:hypothetical protein
LRQAMLQEAFTRQRCRGHAFSIGLIIPYRSCVFPLTDVVRNGARACLRLKSMPSRPATIAGRRDARLRVLPSDPVRWSLMNERAYECIRILKN